MSSLGLQLFLKLRIFVLWKVMHICKLCKNATLYMLKIYRVDGLAPRKWWPFSQDFIWNAYSEESQHAVLNLWKSSYSNPGSKGGCMHNPWYLSLEVVGLQYRILSAPNNFIWLSHPHHFSLLPVCFPAIPCHQTRIWLVWAAIAKYPRLDSVSSKLYLFLRVVEAGQSQIKILPAPFLWGFLPVDT